MESILNWIMANPVIVIIIILVLYLMFTYNNLNAKKKRVEKSSSTIDVYLTDLFDEMTSLLEQLSAAYDHESKVYADVSALRTGIDRAKTGSINDKVTAYNSISNFLATPGIRTESYPMLSSITSLGMFTAQKTSQNQDELTAARNQYNNNASSFNTKISSFPAVIVAKIFGFKAFELFKAPEAKKEAPTMTGVRERIANSEIAIEQAKLSSQIAMQQTKMAAENNSVENTQTISNNASSQNNENANDVQNNI